MKLERVYPAAESERFRVVDRNFRRLEVEEEVHAVVTDFTFTPTDTVLTLQVNATAANLVVTLPSPTGSRHRRVMKTDSSANTVTVTGTINGGSNFVLRKQYDYVELEPNGASWFIVSSGFGLLTTYTESTWTPSLGGNTTYTIQIGTYTKVGRIVTGQVRLKVNALGTGSASTISGLPFAVGTDDLYAGSVGFWTGLSGTYVYVGCYVHGTTLIFTGATAATAGLTAPAGIFGNGADIMTTFTYST